MNEFEELLKEYGLKLVLPEDNHQRLWIKKEYVLASTTTDTAFDGLRILFRFDAHIKVEDVDRVYRKFDISEEYDYLKKISAIDMVFDLYTNLDTREPQYEFNDDPESDQLEIDVAEDPEMYGISERELEIMELYATKPIREGRAMALTNDYYRFLDYLNKNKRKEADDFLKKTKKILKSKEVDVEWLNEKMIKR